jgi:hypothetical protein
LALFWRFDGAAFFFLTTLDRSPPPRVVRLRARLFSCAWSCAARRASASSIDCDRFAFFLAGSGDAEGSVPSMSEVPFAARLVGYESTWGGGESSSFAAWTMSKRSSIRALMAF